MFFGATAFAEAPFSSEGIINQTVELTGVQAATNVDSVSVLAGGSASIATGAEVELESTVNTVEITAEANVEVSTNLLITALGDASIEAEGSVDLTTNLLTTTTDSVSISIGPDVSVSTNLLQTAINSVGVDIAFTIDVVGQQLNSTINSVEVFPVSIVNLSTNLLQSTVNSVVVNANSDVNVNTNLLTVTLGDEVVTGDAIVNLSTNLLQSAVGNAQSTVSKDVPVTGVSATTTTGTLVISIGVQVTGVSMVASVKAPTVFAWAVVNINTTNTWNVVDIAA